MTNLTEEKAIALAWDYVRAKRLKRHVRNDPSVRLYTKEDWARMNFTRPTEWLVVFTLKVNMDPGGICIHVNDDTGECCTVDTLKSNAPEQWVLDKICEQIPMRQNTFRHVLTFNADVLLPAICDALEAQIGPLNRPPRIDLDGTPFIGPDQYEDPDWFRKIWAIPENQNIARKSSTGSEQEACMIVPLDSVERILDEYVGWRDPVNGLLSEECVDWLVSHRHLAPWMIVLLQSDDVRALLFISEDLATVKVVDKTVREVAPASLITMWDGHETALKLDEIGQLEQRAQNKRRKKK